MAFNFLAFCQLEAITHVEGPAKNVRKNHVGLNCPFCGDTGNHLSYNRLTGKWGCWRCSARGLSPDGLIMKLKGCNKEKAKEIIRDEMLAEEVTWDELTERAANLFKPARKKRPPSLEFPDDFKQLKPSGLREKFWDYVVEERGFRRGDVAQVVATYGFRCCLSGRFQDRLIVPVITKGRLVGWTARTIHRKTEPRYIAHPTGDAVKQGIPYHDVIRARGGGEVLVVVEGGLDSPKLDFYGMEEGVHSVPIMGTSATPAQVNLLLGLAKGYSRTVVLLDARAEGPAMALVSQLSSVGATVAFLPEGVKDPGGFRPKEAARFARKLRGNRWV